MPVSCSTCDALFCILYRNCSSGGGRNFSQSEDHKATPDRQCVCVPGCRGGIRNIHLEYIAYRNICLIAMCVRIVHTYVLDTMAAKRNNIVDEDICRQKIEFI